MMNGGARGICSTSASDIYIFNFIIENATQAAIGFASESEGGSIDAEIGNIINCPMGINL